MLINSMKALQAAISTKENEFEVVDEAFDFCDEIHQAQVSGSGTDWSITATNGWMAIFTNFNHSIHRSFMKQAKRDREDLQHIISKSYIIKKTDVDDKYKLTLRK
ncbi:hypothetical protein [Companilactobacillus kimchiensis]|uniref:Uncharacterized protein n=1 Tax=Companilactobacillus kimchiensis TaxID=993692 RepID=A0A0R2LER5_9LACO|nr:hypothetical protein [Companilactobacillus kimchiensis]KRN98405.1 hypothetical protein IV57_GL001136 [Companilactobacillus kimchiensis]